MNNISFLTPLVTFTVAILGWYIVNKQTNYRERRKEIFDLHKRVLETIINMDTLLKTAQENHNKQDEIRILRVQVFALQKYTENIIDLYLNHFCPSKINSCTEKKMQFFDKVELMLHSNLCEKSQQKHTIENEYKKSFYYLQSEIQEQIFSQKILIEPDWAEKMLHKMIFWCKYLKNLLLQRFRKLMENICE